jgi:hypothetical protein
MRCAVSERLVGGGCGMGWGGGGRGHAQAFVASELAKRVKPKHKDKWAKARANKPKAMQSAPVKLTVEDMEAMMRDKIATRCTVRAPPPLPSFFAGTSA